jgi:hypothetical protein
VLLRAEDVVRLIDFARVVKAAARAVSLYPAGHPAVAEALRRVVEMTSAGALAQPLRLTIVSGTLLLDDRSLPAPDRTVAELAELLHSHRVGELVVFPGGDLDAWRELLLLLARAPDDLREEGGIVQAWANRPRAHVVLREIDYAEVLRERDDGEAADVERVIAACLGDTIAALSDEEARALAAVALDGNRLTDLALALERRAGETGADGRAQASALLRLFRQVVAAVEQHRPDEMESALRALATALASLSPETIVALLAEQDGMAADDCALTQAICNRLSDQAAAEFVTRNVMKPSATTERVAEAFRALVGHTGDRWRVLGLAKATMEASRPAGEPEAADGETWQRTAETLLGDVPDAAGDGEAARALFGPRAQPLNIEQAGNDPPERIRTWLATVEPTAQRSLDLFLVLDLLRIEADDDRWNDLMSPIVALLEDLLLVGDFEATRAVVEVLLRETTAGGSTVRRQGALTAIDLLVAGPMMRSITTHLSTIDDTQFGGVKAMCVSLGEVLVKPLAEALSAEESDRTRERLTSIVLAFGPIGRRTVERLKGSPNVAVRRTAIYLLREFGGDEALPDLTELLNDEEPQVQREAVRAILNIGTERAFRILEQALTTGTVLSRDAIMQAMTGMRRERAAPLFAYIVRHTDHRGPLAPVYLRAIESLGVLRDPIGVASLDEALHRGEWWAPRRSARLRTAAAAALARIGTPEARAALEGAAATGARGVRAIARHYLSVGLRTPSSREEGAS